MPRFSIIVINHNSEDIIERFLKSIDNQTYKNIELIILDNNSLDKSKWIINDYYIEHSVQTKFLRSRSTEKANVLKNKGLKYATGEYITFFNVSTIIPDNYFEQVNKLINIEENPDLLMPFHQQLSLFNRNNIMQTKTINQNNLFELLIKEEFDSNYAFFNKNLIGDIRFSLEKTKYEEDFTLTMFMKAVKKYIMVENYLVFINSRKKENITEKRNYYEIVDIEANTELIMSYEKNAMYNGIRTVLFFKDLDDKIDFHKRNNIYEFISALNHLNQVIPEWYNNMYFQMYIKHLDPKAAKIINQYMTEKRNNSENLERKLLNS